ncbi:PhzF family phenazine biosynthesis protein [Angustibacter speluncae]
MDVRFVWVDVFADLPLTGNPLPLVPSADGLTTEQMAAVARELNQSETTFLVAPSADGADVRLRSFTPGGVEVLGAGHNAMGAWIWLATAGGLDPERSDFHQQIGDDVLPVTVTRPDGAPALVTMRQSAPRFLGRADDRPALAASLGLDVDDLAPADAEVVWTGAEHLLVEVRTRRDVDAAVPDTPRLLAVLAAAGAEGCYVFSTEPGDDGAHAYARFFNPTVGIAEDPATGTAAGPLAALLVRDGRAPADGAVQVLQGVASGRASTLRVRVAGDVVELSGSGVLVAEGTLFL